MNIDLVPAATLLGAAKRGAGKKFVGNLFIIYNLSCFQELLTNCSCSCMVAYVVIIVQLLYKSIILQSGGPKCTFEIL